MLDTTFVKIVRVDTNEWDYSCRIVDLLWHMAKQDANAEREAPIAAKKDPCLSKPKANQVAIKDKPILHPCGLHRITGQAGP